MPEYSGTTITPADGVKVPAMNGASGGNFVLSALRNYILASKGQANGLASLDGNGKLPAAQLPDLADDVIVVASYATLPATGESGKIYITADNNKLYRWDSAASDYVELSVDLSAYATKAELNADVATLQSQIDRNKAEIENLKQTTKQDEQTVAYPDDGNYSSIMPNGVPARAAKYGEVAGIRGKSRGWNQLVDKPKNYTDTSGWTSQNVSAVASSGNLVFTFGAGVSSPQYDLLMGIPRIANHKYLCVCTYNSHQATNDIYFRCYLGSSATANHAINNGRNTIAFIDEASGSASDSNVGFYSDGSLASEQVVELEAVILRDLTPMFPEGVPATIAECVQKCPDLLKWDAYDAGSMVDTTITGVESVGVNIWDEVWRNGYYNSSTGAFVSDARFVASTNPIPVIPNKTYALVVPTPLEVWGYDYNGDYVGAVSTYATTSFTVPSGVWFIQFNSANVNSWTTYTNNAQICDNALDSSIKTTYHPYMTDTLSLPSPVTLRSAGSVADTDELNVEISEGVYKRRQTVKTLTVKIKDLSWDENSTYVGTYAMRADISSLGIIQANNDDAIPYVTTTRWQPISRNNQWGNGTIGIAIRNDSIYINDSVYNTDSSAPSFKSAYGEEELVLALQTPSVTLSDPIPDNFIEVEGGGTIRTIQSQSPVIDNCLDVTYDFIPA